MNRINELRACLMIGVAAAAGTVSSGQALAQAAGEGGEGGEGRLEEIVVTAQKREQNVQDIPIAVTAISQGQIAANRINTVQDLSGLAPNMTVRPASGGLGTPAFSMRGAISYGTVPGSDKEVGIYLDGVYLSGSKASIFDIPDIERIEVLRGPQGTLFGRNATAGAVSFTTRDPKGEFGVTLEATVGNYAQRRYRASVDLPAWGPFSAYVSFVHSERRGDIKNLGAGTVWDRTGPDSDLGVLVSPEYLGDRDVNSLFVAVKFEPSDNFSTVYKFDRTVDHFTPEGMPLIAYDGTAGATGATLDALFKNSPNQFVAGLAQRPTVANNSWVVPGVQRNSGHSLTSELRLSDSISLKNIADYRKSYVFGASQIGGMGGLVITPGAVAAVPSLAPLLGNRFVDIATHRVVTSEQWSEELQLNYNSRLLTLTLGGIYFHSKDREGGPPFMRGTFSFFSAIPASGLIPLGAEAVAFNKATSLAAYGQAEVHVTPQIDLVGGIRITNDKKSGTFYSGGTFVPTTPGSRTSGTITGQTVTSFTYDNSRPSFSLGVNYKPTDDILLYAKYSDAFVSGGSIGGVDWLPETAKSWEAGAKATLLDRRLRANLAVFSVTYDHVQLANSGRNVGRPDLGTVVIDLQAQSKVKGFELEVTALPVDGLTLGANVGHNQVKYVGTINPIVIASVGLPAGSTDFQPTLIPSWNGSLSAQYETRPLFDEARLNFRVDANWRSRQRTDSNPDVNLPIFQGAEFSPASWIVNARIALTGIKLGMADGTIALWARNLNDNKSTQFPSFTRPLLFASSFQKARTFGVDLKLSM